LGWLLKYTEERAHLMALGGVGDLRRVAMRAVKEI
jgi:hypothetical protein